jgi:hypothetical protein
MKKVKIVLWIILLGFLAIIFYSNQDYFLAKQSIQIKIPHIATKSFKEMPNVVYFLVFFVIGFFGCLFFQSFRTVQIEKDH